MMARRGLRGHGLEGGVFVVLSDVLINTAFLLILALIVVALRTSSLLKQSLPPTKQSPVASRPQDSDQLISHTVHDGIDDYKYRNGIERITILDSLLFDKGSWVVKQNAYRFLDEAIIKIQARQSTHHLFHIIVEGHTDNEKMKASLAKIVQDDWGLSSNRALSVLRYLKSKNLPQSELVAVARGSYDPRPNTEHFNSEDNDKHNRRVEIILSDKAGDLWSK